MRAAECLCTVCREKKSLVSERLSFCNMKVKTCATPCIIGLYRR